ncbi:MAG: PEGA domain-containing protein [Polyangiaceae bacterium]|nr:PEGA domain-containing protein [Polyangiaceae bacterium]
MIAFGRGSRQPLRAWFVPSPASAAATVAALVSGIASSAAAEPSPTKPSPTQTSSSSEQDAATSRGAASSRRADEARARELFIRATEAADRNELETARALFVEVWELRQTYDVAMNLAEIETHLGRRADAATHAASALALFPPSEDPDTRRHLVKLLDRARVDLGEITVEAPIGARVTVDGVLVGAAPLTAAIFVEPGDRRFEASDGTATASATVTAIAGETQSLTLRFDAQGANAGAAAEATPAAAAPAGDGKSGRQLGYEPIPNPPKEDHRPPKHRFLAPLVASAGITAVGAGLGIAFTVLANQELDDAESLDSGDDSRCRADPDTDDCAQLADARERHDRDRLIRDASFIGGGVGLAATGLFTVLFVRDHRRQTAGSPRRYPAMPNVAITGESVLFGIRGTF